MAAFLLLVLIFGFSNAAEKCCPSIGCFSDDPPYEHLPIPDCPLEMQVSMTVYTRTNPDNGQVVTRTTIPPVYEGGKRTVFLVHGWLGGDYSGWMHNVKDAMLDREDYNVIIVSWFRGATELWYPKSASNTRVVGAEIGMVANNLMARGGAAPSRLWCVGHSLGGHTCGYAGKHAHFGRLTPLDPAAPWFTDKDPSARVTASDADFVDVIHTNTKAALVMALGILQASGHVDFYPNGGGRQPGCIIDTYTSPEVKGLLEVYGDLTPACSHNRVLDLFLESIKTDSCLLYARHLCTEESNLPASCRPCDTKDGICSAMGFDADQYSARGIFYLETFDRKPYCKN